MYITKDENVIQKKTIAVKCDICGKEKEVCGAYGMTAFHIPELDGYMNQKGTVVKHCCNDVDCFLKLIIHFRRYVGFDIINVDTNLVENLYDFYNHLQNIK